MANTTDRLQIKFEKFSFMTHLPVTYRTSKMADTPGLVEGTKHISRYNTVAYKADIPK